MRHLKIEINVGGQMDADTGDLTPTRIEVEGTLEPESVARAAVAVVGSLAEPGPDPKLALVRSVGAIVDKALDAWRADGSTEDRRASAPSADKARTVVAAAAHRHEDTGPLSAVKRLMFDFELDELVIDATEGVSITSVFGADRLLVSDVVIIDGHVRLPINGKLRTGTDLIVNFDGPPDATAHFVALGFKNL